MDKIVIGILDSNQSYAKRFSNFILKNYNEKLTCNYFSELENVISFLNRGIELDVLLVNEDLIDDKLINSYKGNILGLGTNEKEEEKGVKIISKYKPAEVLIKDIQRFALENSNKKYIIQGNEKKTKVISIYSPIGGAGKTTVTIALCQYVQQSGKKSVYINLEDVQTLSSYIDIDNSDNLSELIYSIKEDTKNIEGKVDISIKDDEKLGISYIAPFSCLADKMNVLSEELVKLIDIIVKLEKVDYVFLDMNSSINGINMELFGISDEIFIVIPEDPIYKKRIISFLDIVDEIQTRKEGNFNHSKMKIILNKQSNNIIDRYLENEKGLAIIGNIELCKDIYEKISSKKITVKMHGFNL